MPGNATVDHADGKVTLTLPIGDDGAHAFLATMSPDEARDLASALVARAYTVDGETPAWATHNPPLQDDPTDAGVPANCKPSAARV